MVVFLLSLIVLILLAVFLPGAIWAVLVVGLAFAGAYIVFGFYGIAGMLTLALIVHLAQQGDKMLNARSNNG